jgi:thiol-disulfide isomerase/thioredoxin
MAATRNAKTSKSWVAAAALAAVAAWGGSAIAQDAQDPKRDIMVSPTIAPSAPATQPAVVAKPSTQPAAPLPALANEVRDAYAALTSLRADGKFTVQIDAGGEQVNDGGEFTSSFAAPARFRHESGKEVAIVGAADKTFVLDKASNEYLELAAVTARSSRDKLPAEVGDILEQQNPSLLLALTPDAAVALNGAATDMKAGSPVDLDGVSYPTLTFTRDGAAFTVLVDPKTKLLRQVRIDAAPKLRSQGVPDVKVAQLTIDYAKAAANEPAAADAFAWNPPKDARLIKPEAADGGGELMAGDPQALAGKAAPDFTLASLGGEKVTLSESAKGKVTILDFWATWCPPCRAGLPHLQETADKYGKDGLVVYAINQQEAKPVIERFMGQQKLTLLVLLDTKGEVAKKYFVSGIPQTVVIGKDGKVRKVLVGFGPGSAEQLTAAVEEALKAE